MKLNFLTEKSVTWILRVAVFGEFFGHGVLALMQKAAWLKWISQLTGVDASTASILLTVIGSLDVLVAFIILVKPVKTVILWATFWGFSTALVRPFVGESVLDFVERWANWGAPLALFYFIANKDTKS